MRDGNAQGMAANSLAQLASIAQQLATVGEFTLVVQTFTATASQTVFNLTGGETYDNTKDAFVFVGGAIQTASGEAGDNFTRTSTTRFTMSAGVSEGTKVIFIGQKSSAAGRMLSGAGAPSDANGNNGDFYLNTTNSDFYQKSAGAWGSAISNFKGATGSTGTSYTENNWVEVTGNVILALTDATKTLRVTAAAAITVPPNSDVAFNTGAEIVIISYTSSEVSIAAGSGVTIRSSGSKLKINAQYEGATLKKVSTNEWVLVGSLKS